MAWPLLIPPGMKIIGALFPGRSLASKGSFGEALKQVPQGLGKQPALSAKPPAPNNSATSTQQVFTAHQKTATTLTSARSAAHQGVAHLQEARVAHHHVTNERLDGRLMDLICKELVVEFTSDSSKLKVANQDLPLAPPTPGMPAPSSKLGAESLNRADGSVRAAQAVELIEKIETFIKDSRTPCLALTLNNSLGAKVEIERVGPREVALKVIGHKGPPRAEDIGRIRDEMAAHGLKVCALSVA